MSRATSYIFKLIKHAGTSKNENDVQNFFNFGAGAAWLLSSLHGKETDSGAPPASGPLSGVAAQCFEAAYLSLQKWTQRTRAQDQNLIDDATKLSLLEAMAAQKLLTQHIDGLDDLFDQENIINSINSFKDVWEGRSLVKKETCCPSCHEKHTSKSKQCVYCDFYLPTPLMSIQFSRITEGLVWVYMAYRVCDDESKKESLFGYLNGIINQINRCRPYRTWSELGWKDWQQQIYLITHLCLVLSDWGTRPLSKEQLPEEYLTLKHGLLPCINIDEPELVGEILYCLWLFGCDIRSDQWTGHAIRTGVGYLLERERRFGSTGRYISLHEGFYDHFHYSFCAMMGLITVYPRGEVGAAVLEKSGAGVPPPSTLVPYTSRYERDRTPPHPLMAPHEIPRPILSYDYSSRLPPELRPPLVKTPPYLIHAFTRKKVWLSRRLIPSSFAVGELETLEDVLKLPMENLREGAVRDSISVRVTTVRNERVVVLDDVALALQVPKTICCRLLTHATVNPPWVITATATMAVNDHESPWGINPLTLQPDDWSDPSWLDSDSILCCLGGPLTIIKDDESQPVGAIVVHQRLLQLMANAAEGGVCEEAQLIDTGVLRQLIECIYAPHEPLLAKHPALRPPQLIGRPPSRPSSGGRGRAANQQLTIAAQQALPPAIIPKIEWNSSEDETNGLDRAARALRRSAAADSKSNVKFADAIYEPPKGLDIELSSLESSEEDDMTSLCSSVSSDDPLREVHASWDAVLRALKDEAEDSMHT